MVKEYTRKGAKDWKNDVKRKDKKRKETLVDHHLVRYTKN